MTKITTIADIHDVIKVAEFAAEHLQTKIWWRGQSSTKWVLLPKVYRRGPRGSYQEGNLSVRFIQKALTRHEGCPPNDDFPAWLFLMQHYQLPTRLLDWTESLLVATYFAVKEDKPQSGALWALSPFLLNKKHMGEEGLYNPTHPAVHPLFLRPFKDGIEEIEKVVAIIAQEIDIRMMVQMSAFSIHGTSTPLDSIDDNEKFLIKFEIPSAAKPKLRKGLNQLGLTESNLFPDLDHLASELEGGPSPPGSLRSLSTEPKR